MLKIFHEFKNSLKNAAVEDTVDLFVFRPIAFALVKLIYPLPISPNQISLLSILTGIAGGILFACGTHDSFMYGGLLYLLAHILDCCDGMVARLKKNGSFIGRIIDGFADYITAFAVYIGINIGLYKLDFKFFMPHWIMLAVSGFFMIVHSIIVDYYRREFMAHALNIADSTQADRAKFSAELKRLNREKGEYFAKLMIWVYLGYSQIQLFREKEEKRFDPHIYYRKNRLLLTLWSGIASPTHILIIAISAILFRPEIIFYYSAAAANAWLIGLVIIQTRTNKKIALKSSD